MSEKSKPKLIASPILYGGAWLIIGALSILFFISCASSELTRFKKNTMTMSDAELLNCYHGIHERMKVIDSGIKRENQFDPAQKRDHVYQQTYFVGGEAYGLMQKEKVLLKEMKKRNIKP